MYSAMRQAFLYGASLFGVIAAIFLFAPKPLLDSFTD
jgi:hypothetical protein